MGSRGHRPWPARSRSPHGAALGAGEYEARLLREAPDGLARRSEGSTLNFEALSVEVSRAGWVPQAARIFRQYRVLVLKGLFSPEVTDKVHASLKELHASWSAKCDPDRVGNRLAGRYEMMDAYDTWHLTHLPGYLEALEEFAQKGGLRFLEEIGSYTFVGGHAHLCLSGTHNWQPLHSDFVQPGWETRDLWDDPAHVPFLDLLFALHPLTSENAALRLIPGQPSVGSTYRQFGGQGAFPPPKLSTEPESFKRARLFPLPAGTGVLRDLRIWHGGTPNTSREDRYTAVLRFYSSWSLRLWKERLYEGRGVRAGELERLLSREARGVVAPHIVREDGDPEPQLQDSVAWTSAYDSWVHAYDN